MQKLISDTQTVSKASQKAIRSRQTDRQRQAKATNEVTTISIPLKPTFGFHEVDGDCALKRHKDVDEWYQSMEDAKELGGDIREVVTKKIEAIEKYWDGRYDVDSDDILNGELIYNYRDWMSLEVGEINAMDDIILRWATIEALKILIHHGITIPHYGWLQTSYDEEVKYDKSFACAENHWMNSYEDLRGLSYLRSKGEWVHENEYPEFKEELKAQELLDVSLPKSPLSDWIRGVAKFNLKYYEFDIKNNVAELDYDENNPDRFCCLHWYFDDKMGDQIRADFNDQIGQIGCNPFIVGTLHTKEDVFIGSEVFNIFRSFFDNPYIISEYANS